MFYAHQVDLVPRIRFIRRHPKMVARDRTVRRIQNHLWIYTAVTTLRAINLSTAIIPIIQRVITPSDVSV